MDLVDDLRRAVEVVDSADVPAELRSVAFGKVLDQLWAPRNHGPVGKPVTRRSRTDIEDGGLAQIAARLELPLETVERAFVLEDDRLELVVPAGSLATAKSRATEQIAVLVAAGRQAAGLDEDGWTTVDRIREVCENYKKYDQSNFATTIKSMDDILTVRGTGRGRKVRMTAPGWERAASVLLSFFDGK